MAIYTITATQTKTFEIKVEAADHDAAIEMIHDWIEDDFEDFETGAKWEFEAN